MQLLLECKVRPEVLCNRSNSAKLRASAVAAARCGSSSRKSGACHTERWQHYSDESFQLVDDVGGTTLLRSCQSIRPAGVDLLKLVLLDLQPPASYIHRFSAGTVALQRHGRRTGARLHERMQDPITILHDKTHMPLCVLVATRRSNVCRQARTYKSTYTSTAVINAFIQAHCTLTIQTRHEARQHGAAVTAGFC